MATGSEIVDYQKLTPDQRLQELRMGAESQLTEMKRCISVDLFAKMNNEAQQGWHRLLVKNIQNLDIFENVCLMHGLASVVTEYSLDDQRLVLWHGPYKCLSEKAKRIRDISDQALIKEIYKTALQESKKGKTSMHVPSLENTLKNLYSWDDENCFKDKVARELTPNFKYDVNTGTFSW